MIANIWVTQILSQKFVLIYWSWPDHDSYPITIVTKTTVSPPNAVRSCFYAMSKRFVASIARWFVGCWWGGAYQPTFTAPRTASVLYQSLYSLALQLTARCFLPRFITLTLSIFRSFQRLSWPFRLFYSPHKRLWNISASWCYAVVALLWKCFFKFYVINCHGNQNGGLWQ